MFGILGDSRFYFMLLGIPIVCLLPDFTLHALQAVYYPQIENALMAIQSQVGESPAPPR
jgi:TM2 domain-containing membrane protein YozV